MYFTCVLRAGTRVGQQCCFCHHFDTTENTRPYKTEDEE
jgi:hypothetical protein